MVKKLLLSTFLTVVGAVAAQAAEPTVTYQVKASAISSIETSSGLTVTYTPGAATSVSVTTPENVKQYLDIKIVDGELRATVKSNKPNRLKVDGVKIAVSAPSVTEFEAQSAGTITATGAVKLPGKKIGIEVSSAGNINIPSLTCDKLDIEASSAGNVNVTTCNAKTIDAEASSAANIVLNSVMSDYIDAEAGSAANIILSGKAKRVNFEASSNANIKAASLAADTGNAEASSLGNISCKAKKLTKETSTMGKIKIEN